MKNFKGLYIVSLAALGAAVTSAAVSYVTAKYLIDVAVERELPKRARLKEGDFAGSVLSNEEIEACRLASERLASIKTETVNITSTDGTPLVGHFYKNPNQKRIIIAMHGWRSSWIGDFGFLSEFWMKNECSILFAEQRGQNSSGGKHISFGLIERHDCRDWINYVISEYGDKLPIYLAGMSMGAATVLMTAGSSLPKCVKGVIADCGFTSPRDILKHVVTKNMHLSYGLRGVIADGMFRKRLNMRMSEYSTITAMKNCSVPVLFIHGDADKFVPINMTYKNYEACVSPKRLLVVKGAGHGMSYYRGKEEYEKATREFWKDFD